MSVKTPYYLRRQCQGQVRRTHKFLWWTWTTERYEYDPKLFGSYFMGPFATPQEAKRYALYQSTDVVVDATTLSPELLMFLCEHNAQPLYRVGHREVYLSAQQIAHPLDLLMKLRDIWYLDRHWSSVAYAVNYGHYDRARLTLEAIDAVATTRRYSPWPM